MEGFRSMRKGPELAQLRKGGVAVVSKGKEVVHAWEVAPCPVHVPFKFNEAMGAKGGFGFHSGGSTLS